MLPLYFPFSAWEFEKLVRVSTLQVTSLVFFLVTQPQKTQGTVLEESSGGLSWQYLGAERFLLASFLSQTLLLKCHLSYQFLALMCTDCFLLTSMCLYPGGRIRRACGLWQAAGYGTPSCCPLVGGWGRARARFNAAALPGTLGKNHGWTWSVPHSKAPSVPAVTATRAVKASGAVKVRSPVLSLPSVYPACLKWLLVFQVICTLNRWHECTD